MNAARTQATKPHREDPEFVDWLTAQILLLPKEPRSFARAARFGAYGFTDVRISEAENQDRIAFAYCEGGVDRQGWFLVVVCDGVGGSAHGERAASRAIASMLEQVATADSDWKAEDVLRFSIAEAHAQVLNVYGGRSSTTLVALLVKEQTAAIGWVGDSRAYHVNTDHTTWRVTDDDTLGSLLERSASGLANEIDEEYGDRLSQAIGGSSPVRPNVRSLDPKADGAYLLCTDGVWKPLDGKLDAVVQACTDASELTRRLLLLSEWLGGQDNATGAVVQSLPAVAATLKGRSDAGGANCLVIIPGGMNLVVPLSLMTGSRQNKAARRSAARIPTPKRAPSDRAKTTKARAKGKLAEAQLVIEENLGDEATGTPQAVQEDRTGN